MRPFPALSALLCLGLASCGDFESVQLLDANGVLIPDGRYTEIDFAGDPPGDRGVAVDLLGLGTPSAFVATGGSLRVNSRTNPGTQLVLEPAERRFRPTRYLYTIEGTYNEVGTATASRPARVRIALQRIDGRPLLDLHLESLDTRSGGPVRVLGPDDAEIGQFEVRQPHSIILAVDLEDGTATVTGGGPRGTIRTSTYPLSTTGSVLANPTLGISASATGDQFTEYEIRRVQAVGSR